MLTCEQLERLEPGVIFAQGLVEDTPEGIHMTGSGRLLRWVAVRGGGIPDWAIYCHHAEHDAEYVKRSGDKVCRESHIRKLVPCTDEAFGMYRY